MRRFLLSFLGILLALVAVLAIVVSMRPDDFTITRSKVVNAPAEKVFPHINDLHLWEEWSPWAKLDPDQKTSHSGSESGKGAKFAWAGNSKVGKGEMTITESKPSEEVHINLEFTEPMVDQCDVKFTLKPVEGKPEQTEVTWAMSGKNDFMGKAFDLVMNMDKMVGTDFEEGLNSIKEIVERPDQPKETPPAPTEEKPAAEGESK